MLIDEDWSKRMTTARVTTCPRVLDLIFYIDVGITRMANLKPFLAEEERKLYKSSNEQNEVIN